MPLISTFSAYSAFGFGHGIGLGPFYGGRADIGVWALDTSISEARVDSLGNIYYSIVLNAGEMTVIKTDSQSNISINNKWHHNSSSTLNVSTKPMIAIIGEDDAISVGKTPSPGYLLAFGGIDSLNPSGGFNYNSQPSIEQMIAVDANSNNLVMLTSGRYIVNYKFTGQKLYYQTPISSTGIRIYGDTLYVTSAFSTNHGIESYNLITGNNNFSRMPVRAISNPYSMDIDSEGNVYILTISWHGLFIGQQPISGYGDPAVLKFDSSGTLVWAKELEVSPLISSNGTGGFVTTPPLPTPYSWITNISVNSQGDIMYHFMGVADADGQSYSYFVFMSSDGSYKFTNRLSPFIQPSGLTLEDDKFILTFTKNSNTFVMSLPSSGQIPFPGTYTVGGTTFEYTRVTTDLNSINATSLYTNATGVNLTNLGEPSFTGWSVVSAGSSSNYSHTNYG